MEFNRWVLGLAWGWGEAGEDVASGQEGCLGEVRWTCVYETAQHQIMADQKGLCELSSLLVSLKLEEDREGDACVLEVGVGVGSMERLHSF